MPSPKTPDKPRLFIITRKDTREQIEKVAESRYKAKEAFIADICLVRPSLTFNEARALIATCRLAPGQEMTRGRKPGQKTKRPSDPNDHSGPQW